MRITSNTMISTGLIIGAVPIFAWAIDFYCASKTMALEISELQKERQYIRVRLDDISAKLGKISGIIEGQHQYNIKLNNALTNDN